MWQDDVSAVKTQFVELLGQSVVPRAGMCVIVSLSPVNINLQPRIRPYRCPAIKRSYGATIALAESGFVNGAPETSPLPMRFGADVDLASECQLGACDLKSTGQ